MQTTRRKILEFLRQNQGATASTLSRSFEVTTANIRHHLKALQNQGLVEVIGKKRVSSRGRPAKVYGLTFYAEGADLNILVKTLWSELMGDRPSKQREYRLRRIAKRLVGTGGEPRGPLTQRLYLTIQNLSALNYECHWEAHIAAPQIILERCPFSSVQSSLPEICQLDAYVIEELLGESVTQIAQRSRKLGGPRQCVFRVLESEN
jgi:predicted ArsR family transcriptional regulator